MAVAAAALLCNIRCELLANWAARRVVSAVWRRQHIEWLPAWAGGSGSGQMGRALCLSLAVPILRHEPAQRAAAPIAHQQAAIQLDAAVANRAVGLVSVQASLGGMHSALLMLQSAAQLQARASTCDELLTLCPWHLSHCATCRGLLVMIVLSLYT